MTTIEIFASSIAASLLLGALIGAVAMQLLRVEPLQRLVAFYRHRMILAGEEAAGMRMLNLRRSAPRSTMSLPIAQALVDNDRWSVKAPEERTNVVPIQVQTGRPV